MLGRSLEKNNEKIRKKHRNYSFTSKTVNYSVLGIVKKKVLGHADLEG